MTLMQQVNIVKKCEKIEEKQLHIIGFTTFNIAPESNNLDSFSLTPNNTLPVDRNINDKFPSWFRMCCVSANHPCCPL